MFTSEGNFPVTIMEAVTAASKFCNDQGAFDICLRVQTDDGQSDWWRGEVSHRYGTGNYANVTKMESTFKVLQEKLGWKYGYELSKLPTLVGQKTVAGVKQSSCGKYFNVQYIGGGGAAPDVIDPNEAMQRMQAMMQGGGGNAGGSFSQPQQQQQPMQQQSQQNGFGQQQQFPTQQFGSQPSPFQQK